MANKYYWLRLQKDFFSSKRIKKLRKLAGGDTYTIIYLKMQLFAIQTEGYLTYTGLEKTFAEELALDIDEDPENVAVTVQYLLSCGLMETSDGKDHFLPFVAENIGSESSGARRVREYRERQKLNAPAENMPPEADPDRSDRAAPKDALEPSAYNDCVTDSETCNAGVTRCNGDVTSAKRSCNAAVTQCNKMLTQSKNKSKSKKREETKTTWKKKEKKKEKTDPPSPVSREKAFEEFCKRRLDDERNGEWDGFG